MIALSCTPCPASTDEVVKGFERVAIDGAGLIPFSSHFEDFENVIYTFLTSASHDRDRVKKATNFVCLVL